ncbi:MAG TPA: hypothetical protein VM802_16955 [Chitinophaga sp.]|uniref:terpene synthase family protein n=1 Tax=Chitinophaga sp. TaxID=1869181 RepID=UPI002B8D926E|nr:hypothetical protein [Chitinophaga sp.]HVI46569.1 hypothetical protein [Chitinophaga sp.]
MSSPRIHYPFSFGLNPLMPVAYKYTLDWAFQYNLLPSAAAPEQLHIVEYSVMFTARIYPNADLQGLSIISCWVYLFFLTDDYCDKDKTRWQQAIDEYMEVLRYKRVLEPGEGSPFTVAFSDIWRRMRARMDMAWQRWFVDEKQAYFDACLWEACCFDERRQPAIEEYMEKRPYFSAGHVMLCMTTCAVKFNLPDYIYYQDILQEIIRLGARIVSWANDIHSLGKELQNGDLNMILLLRSSRGLTLEQALDETVRIHNEDLHKMMKYAEELPLYDEVLIRELKRYVNALKAIVSGNHEWAIQDTHRYDDTLLLMKRGK